MSIESIDANAIRTALRALQRGFGRVPSSLTELDVVRLRVRQAGLEDTASSREWAIFNLLQALLDAQLTDHDLVAAAAVGETTNEHVTAPLRAAYQTLDLNRQALLTLRWQHLEDGRGEPLKDLAERLGVSARTLTRRLNRGYALLARALVEAEQAAKAQHDGPAVRSARNLIVHDEQAEPRELIELLSEMLLLLRNPTTVARFTNEQLLRVADHPASDVLAYRLGRIASWSRPRQRLHDDFIPLHLRMDPSTGSRSDSAPPEPLRFPSLSRLLDERPEPIFALLGPPGAGKSTTLRHLELEIAEAGVRMEEPHGLPTTYIVPLAQFRDAAHAASPLEPEAWLEKRWTIEHPHMPALGDLLRAGRMLLLLDGLNEIPTSSGTTLQTQVARWKRFLHGPAFLAPGNRAVIACRSLEYTATLSTPDLDVPRVRIQALRDEQILDRLKRARPDRDEAHWRSIVQSPLLELLRSPFFLRIFLDLVSEDQALVLDGPGLIGAWIRAAVHRELARDNPRLDVPELLSDRDRARLISGSWDAAKASLPRDGRLFDLLARLAYRMQSEGFAGEAGAVRIPSETARSLIDDARAESALSIGEAIGLLDQDRHTGELGFVHQRFQEYFAAIALAGQPGLPVEVAARTAAAAEPDLVAQLERLGASERLPELTPTGWEETVVMAATMSDRPDAFLEMLIEVNVDLAGRCASEGGLAKRCSRELLERLSWALARRSRFLEADPRERIRCARSLAEIGDPRIPLHRSSEGDWRMGPLIEVPSGVYEIGEARGTTWMGHVLDDHVGVHSIGLDGFAIGSFAVRNDEWACFIAAGGYDDPRWWPGEHAPAWLSGRDASAGDRKNQQDWRRTYLREPSLLERSFEQGSLSEEEYENWRRKLEMTDAEFEAHLQEIHPVRKASAPAYWEDPRFNHPAQPVVGISWFEARAYCLWLSACSGLPIRLPTEVEWEAAARGAEGRRFPCGESLAPLAANTIFTRLHQPSPSGVFPASDSSSGISDLAGNTWDWTSSALSLGDGIASFRYPYVSDDGREGVERPSTARLVTRGGSWFDEPAICAAAIRGSNRAGHPGRILGLRLAVQEPGAGSRARSS